MSNKATFKYKGVRCLNFYAPCSRFCICNKNLSCKNTGRPRKKPITELSCYSFKIPITRLISGVNSLSRFLSYVKTAQAISIFCKIRMMKKTSKPSQTYQKIKILCKHPSKKENFTIA